MLCRRDFVKLTAFIPLINPVKAELNASEGFIYETKNLNFDISGVNDVSDAFNGLFKGGNKTVRVFGPAIYLISKTIYLESGLSGLYIYCDDGVVFKLADNSNCIMIKTKKGSHSTIKWFGGVLDGNSQGQAPERFGPRNTAVDFSKGMAFYKVDDLEVANVLVKEVRGHSINHWNCNVVRIHDVVIDAYISMLNPKGGMRGDGITGSSNHIYIWNITGYSNDDMVAIEAGVPWAGNGSYKQSVKTAMISNVICRSKLCTQCSSTCYTWRGVAIYSLNNNHSIHFVSIDNVQGTFAEAGVAIRYYAEKDQSPSFVDICIIKNTEIKPAFKQSKVLHINDTLVRELFIEEDISSNRSYPPITSENTKIDRLYLNGVESNSQTHFKNPAIIQN